MPLAKLLTQNLRAAGVSGCLGWDDSCHDESLPSVDEALFVLQRLRL